MLEKVKKKMEYQLLKSLIIHHPTFFCPMSRRMLDVDDSVAMEVIWPSGRTSWKGPYSIAGCKEKSIAGGDIVQHCKNMRDLLLDRDVQLPLFNAAPDTPPVEHPTEVTIYDGSKLKRWG